MNNFEMQPTASGAKLSFDIPPPTSTTFRSKKLSKHKPQDNFFKKIINTHRHDKEKTDSKVTESLVSMCSGAAPRAKRPEELTHVVYVPINEDSSSLIASLSQNILFMNEEYKQLSLDDIKYKIVMQLLNIPSTPKNLEQQARKGLPVYDFHTEAIASGAKQSSIEIDKFKPAKKIELKVWDTSLIYVKKYYNHLSAEIYDLADKCDGAICIESNSDLLSSYQIREFKKNNDMKAILEGFNFGEKYNFTICANPLIKGLKEHVYLNFFNIPEKSLVNILQKPDIKNLHLVLSPL